MASAGAFQPGASLAEAYAMRKLYKEKMKKEKMAEDAVGGAVVVDREKERTRSGGGRGCFSWSRVFGRKAHVHPSSAAEAPRVAPKDMATTSMAGPDLAEAVVLRKQHKEKMMKKKKQGGHEDGRATIDDEEKISRGCFSWLLHRVQTKTVYKARS